MEYTLNIRGRLLSLKRACVMGIVNATPDSFYADSRVQTAEETARQARKLADEGALMIDVGACSTRPGSEPPSQEEEMDRLRLALTAVRQELPQTIVSVDTFRPDVARMAVEELGADIVNDVGSPQPEEAAAMLRTVQRLHVPYVMMSRQPTLATVLVDLAERLQRLRDMGHADIIVDPGFGFGKTLDQNYALMAGLEGLQVLDLPVLVGISRKSMFHRLLDVSPAETLEATTALHAVALTKGATILRVHDARAAADCIRVVEKLNT